MGPSCIGFIQVITATALIPENVPPPHPSHLTFSLPSLPWHLLNYGEAAMNAVVPFMAEHSTLYSLHFNPL